MISCDDRLVGNLSMAIHLFVLFICLLDCVWLSLFNDCNDCHVFVCRCADFAMFCCHVVDGVIPG